MTIQTKLISAATASVVAALAFAGPAQALTMQECSAKYQAAKTAGTLNGQKWNDFRKTECAADAAATPAAEPKAAEAKSSEAKSSEAKSSDAKSAALPKPAAPAPAAVGNTVFPSAIDPKYAQDSPGKARFKTCVEQYNANKASNANGGLKWIEKGGGYYSECNKKLKS
jgi:hypothetical protein